MYNLVSVDDYRLVNLEISAVLKDANFNIVNVRDESELTAYLGKVKNEIHAVLWTIGTNDEDNFKAIRRIKKIDGFSKIPIMVVSWSENDSLKMKAANAGVAGFLVRPYDEHEVRRTIFGVLGLDLKNSSRQIADDIQTFDLQDMLRRELNAAGRGGHELSIILVTVVADRKTGGQDEYIKLLKNVIQTRLRDTDTCFFYGENGIIILLPFADRAGMSVIEDKIKESFSDNSLLKKGNTGYKLIITGAAYPEDGRTKERLLSKIEKDTKLLRDKVDL